MKRRLRSNADTNGQRLRNVNGSTEGEKKNHTICQTSRPLADKTAEIHTENHIHGSRREVCWYRLCGKETGSLRFLVQVQNRAPGKSQNEEEKNLIKLAI